MVSSHFKSRIPFRPTPQTCYPPPPPPPDPGFIPCLGARFSEFALLKLTAPMYYTYETQIAYPPADGQNMTTFGEQPGIKQWTCNITGTAWQHVAVGIRCARDQYGSMHWQTMLRGIATTPTGEELVGNLPWATNGFVTTHHDGIRWTIHTKIEIYTQWQNLHWHLGHAQVTLTEMPTEPRSRPPHPPIPAIA